jgi:hypothetical protein
MRRPMMGYRTIQVWDAEASLEAHHHNAELMKKV